LKTKQKVNLEEMLDTISDFDDVKRKKERLKQRLRELKEEERIQKRLQDKAAMAAYRVELIRRQNNDFMKLEDARSHKFRLYEQECERMMRERYWMQQCEVEQTLVDRFWGIPTEVRRLKEREERRRWEMRQRVDQMRAVCMQIRILKPYSWEQGKYRDKFTNQIIR